MERPDREDGPGEELGHCVVKKVGDKALFCEVEDLGGFWVPQSVIHSDSEVYGRDAKDHVGKLVVKAWWARKEGLT